MPRRRTKVLIATAATIVVLGGLAAGAYTLIDTVNGSFHIASGPAAAAAAKTPTTVATPADEETAAKVAAEKAANGLTVGAVLTADQATTIGHYWQGHLLPYKMADGTQVLIARDQPLPENVKVDAGRQATAAAAASANSGDTLNGDIATFQKKIAAETGHQIVLVVRVFTVVGADNNAKGWTWMSSVGNGAMYGDATSAVEASQPRAQATGATIIVSQ